ncbi:MAG: hypothetical protein ACKE5M_07525 [Methylophilaceae bacterium]
MKKILISILILFSIYTVYVDGDVFNGLQQIGTTEGFTDLPRNKIKIVGSDKFTTQTESALALLKDLAPTAFDKVQKYIGIIEQGEHSGMWAKEKPPRYEVNDTTSFFSVTWYAGTIAHDAVHSELYHEYKAKHGLPVPADIWSGVNSEKFGILHQIGVMKKIRAPKSEIDYLDGLDGTHCDIDGDGDCDWDDYKGRDW